MRFLAFAVAIAIPTQALLSQETRPIFDVHAHLWNGQTSLQAYEKQLKDAKVEATGLAAMWFGGPNQALEGQLDETRKGNDGILELAAENPKILPVATVHPYDGDAAIAELERVAKHGIKILKIHPHTQKFDASDPRVLTLVRRAGDLGIVVLMDNANIVPADSQNLFNLALGAPKTKFIFAHMGAMNFRFWNILKLARTAENLFANNIYFDISGTAILAADSPIEDEFVWTMRNVSVDYLLLGSDYPQMSLALNLDALDRLGLSDAEREKIRYGNAQRLFGLEPSS
jgi:predicted TIM-barrel fold metal-dependent hydrolase